MHHNTSLVDEPARLAALKRLGVLDTEPEEPFENVVGLVRLMLDVPMATVSLLDEERQWFKARSGVPVGEAPRENSFCDETIRHREPLIIPDMTKDSRFADSPMVIGGPCIRSYAGIPLRTHDGYNIGSLCAIDTRTRDFTPAEIATLCKFARIVMDELELRRIAGLDQLTGAASRRGFIERSTHELDRFRRYGRPASLSVIDIDHFKVVNDTFGHPTGDKVLRQVAELLRAAARPADLLGRLGGEEFGVLMPETDAKEALAVAERFREAIAAAAFSPAPGPELRVTASLGIATLEPHLINAEDWIAAADLPLYVAKRGGRNRCVSARTHLGSELNQVTARG